ncbi:TIGR00730 family Rossman fold protein [Corynebacterium sp. UBA2622]|uniref:TIGR00730 family Rossman fold protein n=1 Tax=Corynebacterium sp. UBA2622 TaxID=1946393 RepID=UPI0025C414B4|nr:TIGR00730 family Rossman fold protein [Corynebacterium sp. UBA2622]
MTHSTPAPDTPHQPSVHVAAVVLRDPAGRVLCVRKHSSPRYQLPGGKFEPGETPLQAAVREVREEVGLALDPAELVALGTFTAAASNEPGHQVHATVYTLRGASRAGKPRASAEIAELAWVDPADPGGTVLAPLLSGAIFPALLPRELCSVAVYAGASTGTNPAHLALADSFGTALARRGVALVYGGSRVGVMGRVAAAAVAGGGETVGVLTRHLASYELRFEELTRLEVVETMAERKARMSVLADAIVALPGGAGTLDELFEEWTNQQLGLHRKPIGLLGADFWAPLVAMIDHMVAEGFIRAADREALVLADDPEDFLDALASWTPPAPRWA